MKTRAEITSEIPQDPRIKGIKEHIERAQFFLTLGNENFSEIEKFRLHIAAIYSCRAVTEIFFAHLRVLNISQDKNLEENLTFYKLIEKIRIHDFHRFGCLPDSSEFETLFLGGLKRLTSSGSISALSFDGDKPQNHPTSASSIDDDKHRPLIQKNNQFWDERNNSYFSLDVIIEKHLLELNDLLADYINE